MISMSDEGVTAMEFHDCMSDVYIAKSFRVIVYSFATRTRVDFSIKI